MRTRTTSRAITAVGFALAFALGIGASPAQAETDVGALTFQGCTTSSLATLGCAPIDGSSADGASTGLDTVESIAVSPDGADVYVGARSGDAVAWFRRDGDTAALSYQGCLTTNTGTAGCTASFGATATGNHSPLDGVTDLAVSEDGLSVYVTASTSRAISMFIRDAQTGEIHWLGCLSSKSQVTACADLPGTATDGTDTMLDSVESVAISPDESSVYTVSSSGDTIAHFGRSTTTGVISLDQCITSNSDVEDCAQTDDAVPGGTGTILDGATELAASPDGRDVYVTARLGKAVTHFARNEATGALAFATCVTSDSDLDPACERAPDAVAGGAQSTLESAASVAISPDGSSVYVANRTRSALNRFARDEATGELTFEDCIGGSNLVAECPRVEVGPDGRTGMQFLHALTISPDGASLYGSGNSDDAISRFDRDLSTGELEPAGCVSSRSTIIRCTPTPDANADAENTSLDRVQALAISHLGDSLHAPSSFGHAVTTFTRALEPTGNGGSGDGGGGGDGAGGDADSDTAVSAIIGGKRLKLNRKGVGRVRVTCPANEASPPCQGTVLLRTHRKVRPPGKPKAKPRSIVLARRGFKAGAGVTRRVRVRLGTRKLSLLRRAKRARQVRVVVRVRDQANNSAKVVRRQRAVLPRRR